MLYLLHLLNKSNMSIIRNNIVLWNKMMKENEEKVVDIFEDFLNFYYN